MNLKKEDRRLYCGNCRFLKPNRLKIILDNGKCEKKQCNKNCEDVACKSFRIYKKVKKIKK